MKKIKNGTNNKMCISLDFENKDSNLLKTSRYKDSTFVKKYKEKFEDRRTNTSSNLDKDESKTQTQASTRSTEASIEIKNPKQKIIHKFSNSLVSKSPRNMILPEKDQIVFDYYNNRKLNRWKL